MSLKLECLRGLLAAAWLIVSATDVAALEINLDARALTVGPAFVERLLVTHDGSTQVEARGVSHTGFGAVGEVVLACRQRPPPRCMDGTIRWTRIGDDPLEFDFERTSAMVRLSTASGAVLHYRRVDGSTDQFEFRELPLKWVPAALLQAAGQPELSGMVSGDAGFGAEGMQAEIDIEDLDFDTSKGRFAGAGLTFSATLGWQYSDRRARLEVAWSAGEALLGPAYLLPPDQPVELYLQAVNSEGVRWQIEDLRLNRQKSLGLTAAGRVSLGGSLRIDSMDIELAYAHLGPLWRQGLESVAATKGWGQLDPTGRLSGRLRIEDNALVEAGMHLADAAIDDASGRISMQGLGARLDWRRATEALEASASWGDARFFRIPLGPAALRLSTGRDGVLALVDPFRLPILDGALVLERLEWRDWLDVDRQLNLDARLEPIDLSELTRTLGWTEFGGRLSGSFPGVRLAEGVFAVEGGLELDLFGGTARIDGLSIERPFGALPALAADVEFQRLDLEQVTGAFEFGRMLGLMSGHLRDLRLLDWQPVRFDAWFETLEDSPRRQISQKAVGSISSLSGGGSAALSSTLLRWFDDFPYRKAGLGCRLAANVCRMRGLRDADNGGYVILEGRLIPRLDIVGFKRRVDWPRLLAQLEAAAAASE